MLKGSTRIRNVSSPELPRNAAGKYEDAAILVSVGIVDIKVNGEWVPVYRNVWHSNAKPGLYRPGAWEEHLSKLGQAAKLLSEARENLLKAKDKERNRLDYGPIDDGGVFLVPEAEYGGEA